MRLDRAGYPHCPASHPAGPATATDEPTQGGIDLAVATTYTEKTDEQRAITEMVRQFVDERVIPIAEEHDHEDKFPEAVVEQMKELGLFGVTIPDEYGGLGVDPPAHAVIVQEGPPRSSTHSGIVNTP